MPGIDSHEDFWNHTPEESGGLAETEDLVRPASRQYPVNRGTVSNGRNGMDCF